MAKKSIAEKIDGLSPKDLAKIRSAVRQIWHRSHPRKLAVKRSTAPDGFAFCESCGNKVPKNQIDHIVPVGDLLNGGIERMFCSSTMLLGLCPVCHKEKTKKDLASMKVKKK